MASIPHYLSIPASSMDNDSFMEEFVILRGVGYGTNMGKKYLFILLIVLQLSTILYLGKKIYQDKANTLGISINIDGERGGEMGKNSSSSLTYFYEPEANTEFDEEFPWDTKKKIFTTINSDTLHNVEINISSEQNIIALGDSFTYGEFVNRNDNWVSLLSAQMEVWKTMRVVNFGVEGYDIEYAVERFRIRGAKYDPKLVIWFLKGDDFISITEKLSPIVEEEKEIFKKTEMSDPADLVLPKNGAESPTYIKRALDRYIKSFGGIKKVYEYQEKKLRSLRKYYKGPLLIMYLNIKDEHLEILNKWKKDDKDVHLFSVSQLEEDQVFPDSHPNEKGHKRIARELFEFLKKNNDILK